jgi:AraC-like DNA-binding protein
MQYNGEFLRHIENTIRFVYYTGDITPMVPGQSTQWRVLPSLVVAQLLNGGALLSVAGEEVRRFQPRDVLCIPPGVRHRIDNAAPEISRWSHFNIYILGAVDITALVDLPRILSGESAERIGDINQELAGLNGLPAPELRHLMRRQALGYSLAELLLEAGATHPHAREHWPHLERLAPVLTYIHENISRPLTREELARQIHLSPSRFYALFNEAMGLSPSDYLQNLRLQHAQHLLLNSGAGVAEIAAASGYTDAFHFSRLFRRQFGASPLQYRKQVLRSLRG